MNKEQKKPQNFKSLYFGGLNVSQCKCHCHNDEDGKLAAQGIQCKCIKNCIHCHPENFMQGYPIDTTGLVPKPQEAITNPEGTSSSLGVQEDIFDEFDKKFAISQNIVDTVYWGCYKENVKDWIQDNFIAKRDLRKLLEEKKRVMAHIVGAKRVETPYVVIDDILAAIEKL